MAQAERAAPRVLLSGVVLGQPMGGVRRHNQELLPRAAALLESRGGSLTVLAGSVPPAFELPASISILHRRVPARPLLVRAAAEGRALAHELAAAAAAGRPFELVHTAHLPVPRRLPAPFTLTLHDLRSLDLRHTPMSRRLIARRVLGEAVRRAVRVITVSRQVQGRLSEQFGCAPARLALVPNAADHFDPAPRRPGPAAPLLHVGHLEPRKNLELLLHALALEPALPDLVLAGEAKRDEAARLAAKARELGVEHRVHFRGAFPDSELPRLYAECACVVLPSRLEGFGIPALEALRAEAPLVVARAGALPEVAGPSVPSFDPDDARECVQALRTALARESAAWEPAFERARATTWDAAAEALVETWTAAALQAARR